MTADPIVLVGGPDCGKDRRWVALTPDGRPPIVAEQRYQHSARCGCAQPPMRGAAPDPHVYEWRPERVGEPRPKRREPCCAVVGRGCPRWEPKADAP